MENGDKKKDFAMSTTSLNAPHFHDDDAAREYLQSIRWPDGPVCPHCGVIGNHYQLEAKAHRKGLYKCCEPMCRNKFSSRVGTVSQRTHMPLSKCLAPA